MSVLIRLFAWERSDPMELKFLPSPPGAVAMSIAEVVTDLYAAYTMSRYTRALPLSTR